MGLCTALTGWYSWPQHPNNLQTVEGRQSVPWRMSQCLTHVHKHGWKGEGPEGHGSITSPLADYLD